MRSALEQDVPDDSRVLEIAAGTGQFTASLAALATSVVSTDISPKMVEGLRQRSNDEGLANVDVEVMSAYELAAGDGTFDVVFCANALHVMETPTRALEEFHRVLRRDGLLIAPTFLHGTGVFRRGLSRTLGWVSPFVAHTRFDLTSLQVLIGESGFEVARAEQLPGLFPLGYVVARRVDRRES